MPFYDYRCTQCGVFEINQKINEKPLEICPNCKNKVKRIISKP
jgi:putative FmdB family regulatory protein